jgi:hypothetical protein
MTSSHQTSRLLQNILAALSDAIEKLASTGKPIAAKLGPEIFAFVDGLENLPDKLHHTVRRLVERGWFISGRMDLHTLSHFERLIESRALDQLDNAVSIWIEHHLERILCDASIRFPQRAKILQAAFSAHRTGAYELSIPVLLAQTDGMCQELLRKKLFSKKNGVPITKEATDALVVDAFSEILLLALREENGLNASEQTRGHWPNSPNRHEIMHGISTDYASKLNSLKTISLLEYLVGIVEANSN